MTRLVCGFLTGLLLYVTSASSAATVGPLVNPANGHRYYMTDDQMTWASAESWAVTLGGHLVTINDAPENAWVVSVIPFPSGWFWLGARDDANTTDTVFDWISGEPWDYTAWTPGEPDDDAAFGGQGDYVVLDTMTGQWYDTQGNLLSPGAIAEIVPTTGVDVTAAGSSSAVHLWVAQPSDGVRIRFGLSRETSIRLTVYDALGRSLRTLAAGTLPAGPHDFTWDGKTDQGRTLHSGIYFVNLKGDGIWANGRIVIAR